MSDERAPQPICPSCKEALPQIAWNLQGPVGVAADGPPAILIAFYCPLCYIVINCQLTPVHHLMPALPPGSKPSGIVMPGGRRFQG